MDRGREIITDAAIGAGRPCAPKVVASVPLAVAPDRGSAAKVAARWLITYATRMGPVYPRVLRAHGYGPELDSLLDANAGSGDARLPAAAERLARDLLVFGTHDEVGELCRTWLHHADELTLVAPFGVPSDHLTGAIEALGSALAAERASSVPASTTPHIGAAV